MRINRRRFLKYAGAAAVIVVVTALGFDCLLRSWSLLSDQITTHTTASTPSTTPVPYSVPEPKPVRCPFDISAAYLHSFVDKTGRDAWSSYHLHPLLGYYKADDPWIADWHIKWAVEHGVRTFAVNFQEVAAWGKPNRSTKNLNNGLLKAKYIDYINFYAFYDSAIYAFDWSFEDFKKITEDTATYLCENYFRHPRYLRQGNRPVLDVFSHWDYVTKFGEERFISAMETIRNVCNSFGFDVYLVTYAARTWNHDQAAFYAKHFDALSSYSHNEIGASGLALPRQKDEKGYSILVAPYDTMVQGYGIECKFWFENAKAHKVGFIPSLCPAFSNRRMYELGIEHGLVERTNSTPSKFRQMCEVAKSYVDPELNRIYVDAWNEFPEDSLLEPTVENGFGYLDALRDAYCERPAEGWPPNLYPTKEGVLAVWGPRLSGALLMAALSSSCCACRLGTSWSNRCRKRRPVRSPRRVRTIASSLDLVAIFRRSSERNGT